MSPRRINQVSLALLVLGWVSAVAIYLTANPGSLDPALDEIKSSKRFHHEMRVIGGKANEAFAEMSDGFASLWHGQSLGGTVAVLTVIVTLMFRFVAARPDIYAPHREPQMPARAKSRPPDA